jgi:hypothetical protein
LSRKKAAAIVGAAIPFPTARTIWGSRLFTSGYGNDICKLEDTFFNSPQFIPGTGQHAVDINLRIFTIRT